jgi:hypothetical protein
MGRLGGWIGLLGDISNTLNINTIKSVPFCLYFVSFCAILSLFYLF